MSRRARFVSVLVLCVVGVSGVGSSHDRWTGDPVSASLHEADLHDVFRELVPAHVRVWIDGRLAGARATVEVTRRPWDQVVDEVLRAHGLVAALDRDTNQMLVRPAGSDGEPGLIEIGGPPPRSVWV